jgi:hypothetical protein
VNAVEIISHCRNSGVTLTVDAEGKLHVRGDKDVIATLREDIKAHKARLIAILQAPLTLNLTREDHRQEALTTVKLGESVYRETADNGAGRIGARESMASDLEAPQGGATATPTSPIKHARRRALASTPPPHIGPITDGQQGPLSFLYSVLRDGVGREESLSARASGASQRPLSS